MNNFKLIIAPSSEDERIFKSASNYAEAMQILISNPEAIESATELSFETAAERTTFLQGYNAAIGYNGNGLTFTHDIPAQTEKEQPEKFDLEDWAETHYEFVRIVEEIADGDDLYFEKYLETFTQSSGTDARWEAALKLTNDFRAKFPDEAWGETLIWDDEIEKFIYTQIFAPKN